MSQGITVPAFINLAMKFVFGTPLPELVSNAVRLLTFTRRKSGQTNITPVRYAQTGDQLPIFPQHAEGWRNPRGGATITLPFRDREL